jgi:signal transduction histidine kinase
MRRRRLLALLPDVLIMMAAVVQQVELWSTRRSQLTAGIVVVSLIEPLVLLLRRRWPLASVLVVYSAIGIGIHLMPEGLGSQFLAFLVTAVVTGTLLGTPARIGWCGGMAIAAQLAFLEPQVEGGGPADFATTALVFTACWSIGLLLARRPHERATELVRLGERGRQAADAERARLTREVHDVLAHGLTVVVVQTVAAREALRAGAPQQTLAPRLEAVEDSARTSLAELRSLLRALPDAATDAGAGSSAPPGVDDLPALVAAISRTGLRAELRVSGSPVTLDEGRGLAVYRLVQESMTNALKHATASAIDVALKVR